jgi:hypothetical protein
MMIQIMLKVKNSNGNDSLEKHKESDQVISKKGLK